MTFHWNWYSKKGFARVENQDYAGIAISDNYLFAVIADGVSLRPKSGELARNLVISLVDLASSSSGLPTSLDAVRWVEDSHHLLKNVRAPGSSTSFLAACFSRDELLFAVHAGDCRICILDEVEGIFWKTHVHSVATALKPLSEEELRIHPARHQLTRTFSTKRFNLPSITPLSCKYPDGAILATDGFWSEVPISDQRAACFESSHINSIVEDDVSLLIIKWKPGEPIQVQQKINNLYIRNVTA